MSGLANPSKEGKLDVPLGASTLAHIEVAVSRGFEIGAVVLLRPSPSRGTCQYLFVLNTLVDQQVADAFSEELEARGFPRGGALWAKQ